MIVSTARACPHPESRQRDLFTARDYISGELFTVVECAACGLVRTVPQPAPHRLQLYYPSGYYGETRRYPSTLEWLLGRLYTWRAWSIERASGRRRGRVLDVGCGRGQVLDELRQRGWTVTGTELSEESGRYAREALGLDVLVGDLVDLHLPSEAYDVAILWHVLEHVPDPASLLEEIARLLCPGGTLLVAVPNFASLEARRGKARWFHLDVPRHLHHFTPDVLNRLLEGAGLQPESAQYLAPEYDVFSFVQTALNMLGIRQNVLYNLLRTRGAKVLSAGEPPSGRDMLLSLLLAPALAAIGALWTPLAALLGRGGTVSMYARKRQTPHRP